MMWLSRALLKLLKETVSASFAQGGDDAALLHKFLGRLRALRLRARRLSRGASVLFLGCTAGLAFSPLFLGGRGAIAVISSLATAVVMVTAVLGALEAARLVTWIEALEDLLSQGTPLGPFDLVKLVSNTVGADLAPEPNFEPLVVLLSRAYDTTPNVRGRLAMAHVSLFTLNLNQPVADVWRDALRAAHRQDRLQKLLAVILEDPEVCSYHDQIRACSPTW